MSLITGLLIATLAWLSGWIIGHEFGKRTGTAQGWLDRYFQEYRERQPRNARGQFAERVSGGRN